MVEGEDAQSERPLTNESFHGRWVVILTGDLNSTHSMSQAWHGTSRGVRSGMVRIVDVLLNYPPYKIGSIDHKRWMTIADPAPPCQNTILDMSTG